MKEKPHSETGARITFTGPTDRDRQLPSCKRGHTLHRAYFVSKKKDSDCTFLKCLLEVGLFDTYLSKKQITCRLCVSFK